MAEAFLGRSAQDRLTRWASPLIVPVGRPAHLRGIDVWVVWALATLYASPLGEHLVFKGGTSLSKAAASVWTH